MMNPKKWMTLACVLAAACAVAYEREPQPVPPIGPQNPMILKIQKPGIVLAAWLSIVQPPEDGPVCALAAECSYRCTFGEACCSALLSEDALAAEADCESCVCVVD